MAKRKHVEHGGVREGSGRPSYFNDKGTMIGVRLTTRGFGIADRNVDRLNRGKPEIPVTRRTLVEALIRKYGPVITVADIVQVSD